MFSIRKLLWVSAMAVGAALGMEFMTTMASARVGVSPGAPFTGETVVVTTLNDIVDFGGSQTVADLPGPDGKVSFREAIIATNNTPGPQTIAFAIPQDEWWLFTELALLRLEDGVFVITDNQTTVDFSTQTAFTGDTNPDGNEVGIYGLEPNGAGSPAIIVNGSDCLIRGLDVVSSAVMPFNCAAIIIALSARPSPVLCLPRFISRAALVARRRAEISWAELAQRTATFFPPATAVSESTDRRRATS